MSKSAVPPSAPTDARSGAARIRGGSVSRWILRACLAVVAISCVSLGLLSSLAGGSNGAIDPSRLLVVTLAEGPTFGTATTHLGEDLASPALGDEALLEELRSQLSTTGREGVLLQVAPGVALSAVARVHQLLSDAQGPSSAPIHLRRYVPSPSAP